MLISYQFINMNTHKKYILASTSKSRYSILKNSGFIFNKVEPLCNEDIIKKSLKQKQPALIAKKLSYEKAKSVSQIKKYQKHFVIGCDTLIYIGNKIFDKAKTMSEAKQKIKKLSGKKHIIVTGLTICRNGKKIWQTSVKTKVEIRDLSINDVDRYLKKTGKKILGSVGCYQVEALGPTIIKEIKGDFFNVMGLPLFKLLKYTNGIK